MAVTTRVRESCGGESFAGSLGEFGACLDWSQRDSEVRGGGFRRWGRVPLLVMSARVRLRFFSHFRGSRRVNLALAFGGRFGISLRSGRDLRRNEEDIGPHKASAKFTRRFRKWRKSPREQGTTLAEIPPPRTGVPLGPIQAGELSKASANDLRRNSLGLLCTAIPDLPWRSRRDCALGLLCSASSAPLRSFSLLRSC